MGPQLDSGDTSIYTCVYSASPKCPSFTALLPESHTNEIFAVSELHHTIKLNYRHLVKNIKPAASTFIILYNQLCSWKYCC